MTTHRCLHLSASAISSFKACPTRFFNAYIEGVRADTDTESQRQGTNWHALHEVYRNAGNSFDAAIAHLNDVYTNVPSGFDAEAWEIERTVLAVCFAGYHWYYQNDPIDVVATEIGFKMPLHHPRTRLPLPVDDVVRVGKIDTICRRGSGGLFVMDYKSTSKSIDADSDFWNHLNLDTQISMYVLAATELVKTGDWMEAYNLNPMMTIEGAMYDVWHKPTIRPSDLTQTETKALIETGMYLEQKFEVQVVREWEESVTGEDGKESKTKHAHVKINGQDATVKPGKKAFALRETPAMYGARLLADVYLRPAFYFARREIARTEKDMERFRGELYNIYQTMKMMRDNGFWFKNEHSCNATFRCAYIGLCPSNVDLTNGHTPAGFKRLFTDLTVNSETVEI